MLELSTLLAASADVVWAHATSMDGVNAELGPLLRMTSPADARGKSLADVRLGQMAFVSYILLFGVLPIERWQLTLVELGPGRRFLERSPTALLRTWEHERTVEDAGSGSRVTDRLRVVPRVPGAEMVVRPMARRAFANRHRNLIRMFGAL